MMGGQPADAGDVGEEKHGTPGKIQGTEDAGRQGQERPAAPPKDAAAKPEQNEQQKDCRAERMPVQGLQKVAVAEANERPGKPAAGAGQAGQVVKQADGGETSDLSSRAVRQRQQHTGSENSRQNQKNRSGIGFLEHGLILPD